MVSNTFTFILALVALGIYSLYVLSSQGVLGLLVSFAIALITAAFVDKFEYIVISVLVIGLTYILAMHKLNCRLEGFGTDQDDVGTILKLNNRLTQNSVKPTLSTLNRSIEGFAPADNSTEDEEEEDADSSTSTAAPVAELSNTTKQIDQDASAIANANINTNATMNSSTASPVAQPSAASTAAADVDTTATQRESFQDEENSGLFKLGQLPSESKAGPFVDVASTMSKAMGNLKPDQIAAMTAESKSLLETQQQLMGMLESMRPVLQDGRQLLDTFGSIFGGMGGMGMKM
uniref:Uncharacterized protein n=1 Tax=viral metagenome TaxID=1070528 RepID=A0A6C0K1C3_9ZZZZ